MCIYIYIYLCVCVRACVYVVCIPTEALSERSSIVDIRRQVVEAEDALGVVRRVEPGIFQGQKTA